MVFFLTNMLILGTTAAFFGEISIFVIGLLCCLLLLPLATGIGKSLDLHLPVILTIMVISIVAFHFGYNAMFGTPYYLGGSDDLKFEVAALKLHQQGVWSISEISDKYIAGCNNSKGYLIFLVWLIRLAEVFGGYTTLIPRLVNVYLLLATAILMYKFYQRDSGKRPVMLLYAIALFPNSLLISSFIFRDVLSCFLLVLVFYLWNVSRHAYSVPGKTMIITGTLVISYFSYWIRNQTVFFIAVIVLASLFVGNRQLDKVPFAKKAVAFIVALVVLSGMGAWSTFNSFLVSYGEYRQDMAIGLSSSIFGLPLLPLGFLARALYGLMSPFPGILINIGSWFSSFYDFSNMVVAVGVIVQVFFIPYLVRGIMRLDSVAIVFIGVYVATVGLTFTFRHFMYVYPFMFTLMISAYQKVANAQRRRYLYLTVYTLIVLTGIYLPFKLS